MSVRLERMIRIYNRLRRGPVTIEIISQWAQAAGIKVSNRQLYRDLNELERLQVAEGENVVEFTDEKNRKTWKLEYEEEPGEKISPFDINSFFLLKNFAPYAILESRTSSIEKFEKIIYKSLSKTKYQQYIQANELYMTRTNYMDNLYGEVEHKQIEELIWALHNKRCIVIEQEIINTANLHLPEDAFPLSMLPIELMFHRGRVHIAGLGARDNRLLIFAVDKDLRFRLTNNTFNRKKLFPDYQQKVGVLFGISEPINNKVHHIKLEFTKGFAESFKNFFWHHTQQWQVMQNGNYMLHLHCTIGRELIGFIVFGLDKIKVHQPKTLKNLVLKKLKQNVAVYEHNLPIEEKEANKDY